MKQKNNPLLRGSCLALVAITFGALPAFAALSTWDGGASPDTNIDTPANWNPDGTPTFSSTLQGLFQTTTAANINTNVTFGPTTSVPAVAFGGNFTMNAGGGNLTIYATNSGTQSVLRTNSGASSVTINAPIQVFATSPAASPLGGVFVITVNNGTAANTALNIAGGISKAGANNYELRFGNNVTAGVVAAKAKISGPISGMGNLVNANTGAGQWTGDLIIAGDQASVSTSSIVISSGGGFGTPQPTARILLGETTGDDQTWQNITLNNVMNVVAGGTIIASQLTIGNASAVVTVPGTLTLNGAVSDSAAGKIVGTATAGTIKFTSGTIDLANIGGATDDEKNLNIEKIGGAADTLTLVGTHEFTGTTTVTGGILDIGAATLSGTSALSVGASGTLGLSSATPSTIPGTATFTAGSKVKLNGSATDGAVIMTATAGMSGTAPTLDPAVPGFITEISGNELKLKSAVVPAPLNTWDAGAAPDANINTAANWGQDTLPASTASVTFGDAGSTATVNVDTQFAGVTFNRAAAFTVAGPNNLILSSVNSGSSTNLVVSNFAGGTQTIDAPLQVDTTNTTNKFLSLANNSTTQTLDINGAISRSSGSTADYALRFQNAAGSVTRIDGALNNISGIQQGFSGTVAGDLIFGGNRTSAASVSIAGTSSGVAPATTARLFLGETPADIQTWGNLSLQNTMKLVVGGNITAGTISVGGNASAANTSIVGNSATNSTLSLTGGTISNLVTIGGADTNENNLNLTKEGAGTLTISGGTHTYLGTTTVNGGTLSLASTVTLPSSISVNAGAALAGEGTTTGTLTFGSGSTSLTFDPTTPEYFTADSVDLTNTGTIYVSPSTVTTSGTPVVLKRVTGSFTPGDLAKFVLASRGGTLAITGATNNEITLNAAPSTPASLVWKGNAANPTYWDSAVTQNWINGVNPDRFYSGDDVTFNDTATTSTVDIQGASVTPGNVVFTNTSAKDYTVNGGGIFGTGSLSKSGNGLLTLANSSASTFSGGLDVTGGILAFSAVNQLGSTALAIDLNSATLRFTGASSSVSDSLALTLGASGGTIDCTTLNATFRLGGKVSGNGNLLKTGAGILALGKGGNTDPLNDFSGTLTVTGGSVDIRHANSLGESDADSGTSIQNAILMMQNFGQTAGTITVTEPLDFSGSAFLTGYCQEGKIFTQQFNGPVNVAASAVLGISTARNSSGAIAPTLELNTSTIVTGTGSVLSFGLQPGSYPAGIVAAAQTINVGSAISGPGAVTAQGDAGSVYTLSAPGYSGNTTVNSGTLKLGAANANNDASTVTIASGGAKIDIAFSGNDSVAALVLGGTNMGPGTYNATSHPAFFTGTGGGNIVVAPTSGFTAWANANAPGQTVAQDHDNDGVDNGIEYFMGQSGSAFTATPVLNSSNVITWTMGATYTGTYGTDYVIQTSNELTTWAPVLVGDVTIVPGASVSCTLSGPGKRFVRLLVKPN